MDAKKYLTNKHFCPIPWTGFMYNSDGNVQNCICNRTPIGNLKEKSLHEILSENTEIKKNMLQGLPGSSGCDICYKREEGKNKLNIISDRIFYLRELKDVPMETYKDENMFDLHKIDIRWSNTCNHACVYCGPEYSSMWEHEIKIKAEEPPAERVEELKKYVFDNVKNLKHVYLAGGEPLLMKENVELLELLLEHNPNVNLRVNTNLSKTGTPVFDLICQFKNVHWIVSMDTVGKEFEYIRYGSVWNEFLDNLDRITKLGHKLSFNMLWFVLNHSSLFTCVDFLKERGFHNNNMVLSALLGPPWWDVRNLPEDKLAKVKSELEKRIKQDPGYLLSDGYVNLLRHLDRPFNKNLSMTLDQLREMDKRRGLDSKTIFPEVYECSPD